MTVAVVLLGLLAGAALGWFLGSRPVAEWRARYEERDAEARELDEKFRRAITELAAATERASHVDRLSCDLAGVRSEREALSSELAGLKSDAGHFAEQQRLLIEAKAALTKEFEAAGAKVLEGAQAAFLSRAQDRFTESEKTSEARIKALLEPVGQRLKSYEEQVGKLEKERVDAFGQLGGLIDSMRAGQEQVRAEAARLGNSLRSAPKASGRWGELQVENVLDKCGLSPHTDFRSEASLSTEDGRLRPDFIVDIPGDKKLIIDAKNIWADYDSAYSTDDVSLREKHLDAHAKAVRTHILALSSKNYFSHWEGSAEYVILFIPGEHLLYAALERDNQIWNFAFDKNVLLATPTNLVAIAKTVARVWQQVGLEKEAREIGKLASDLYDSLAKTQDDFAKMGIYLGRAVNSFNDFAKTYDGNVLSRARRLKEKHVKILKREVSEEIPLVEAFPRLTPNAEGSEPPAVRLIDPANDGATRDAG